MHPTHTYGRLNKIYTKREHVGEDTYYDDYYFDKFLQNAKAFGKENVRPLPSPYLMPYVYKRWFLDKQ